MEKKDNYVACKSYNIQYVALSEKFCQPLMQNQLGGWWGPISVLDSKHYIGVDRFGSQ